MIQNYSRYRIFQEFLVFPRKNYYIRELSRKTKIAQPSVINHLNALLKESLILKEKKGIYPSYKANRDDELFKLYKKINLVLRIKQTGLLDYLYDSCLPNAIILFGSGARGEDIEESDIDIYIQAEKRELILKKYEKMLNSEISLVFEENFSKLSKELRNNILNGAILKGYLKVF